MKKAAALENWAEPIKILIQIYSLHRDRPIFYLNSTQIIIEFFTESYPFGIKAYIFVISHFATTNIYLDEMHTFSFLRTIWSHCCSTHTWCKRSEEQNNPSIGPFCKNASNEIIWTFIALFNFLPWLKLPLYCGYNLDTNVSFFYKMLLLRWLWYEI